MVWNSEKTAHEELVPETAVKETRGLTREGDTLGYARISKVGQDAADQQDLNVNKTWVFLYRRRRTLDPDRIAQIWNTTTR